MDPQLDDQRITVGMLDLLQFCLGKCDASWLKQVLPWLFCRWLDREYLVHFSDNADLPSDPILKIGMIWGPNHVDSPEGEVFI